MSSDTAIRVRGLSKAYTIKKGLENQSTLAEQALERVKNPFRRATKETFWALKDIDLDIKQGEVVGIIGRNGAGKSTLLKVLSRITAPTKGEIDLYGRVGSLLEVGTGFHPELTGRENIYLNGSILGMTRPEIKAQFDAIVDFAGVEKFLETPVKRYSSGMYVRLAFAVAAHFNPEILAVDEVLSVGDSVFQKKCLGKMKDITGQGRTVLFVSHNMGAVNELCDKGYLLSKGTITTYGSISDVITQYMSEATTTTHIDSQDVQEQTLIGPAQIIRCGVAQRGRLQGAHFSPNLPIHLFAEIQHVTGASLSMGVRIRSGMGQELLHVTSQDDVDCLRLPSDRAKLQIDLPALPLNDGTYTVMFYLGDRAFQLQHLLVDAVSFTVDTSDQGHTHATGPLKVQSNWSWQRP